jgi:cell division protein FtsB
VISIAGLATIFSGAYYWTVAVAIVLEIAKIVTAGWLQYHWHDVSKKVKSYLCFAVGVLMIITSIGVYGFFARAHIEQQISITTGDASKIPLLDQKVLTLRERVKDIEEQIKSLDTTTKTITDKAKTSKEATASLNQLRSTKASRDRLLKEKEKIQAEIADVSTEKIVLENKVKKIEAEVGPLKYIANLFYGEANAVQLEHAVRWLIIIIVSVFDPLAVVLIMATNAVSRKRREEAAAKTPFKFVVHK